jgi:hypothetical protein
MRNKRLEVRASESDFQALTIAKANLEQMTGKKQNASKTVRAAVKMAAENKPVLFFCNRNAIRDVDNNINTGQGLLQALVDELIKAAPGINFTITDISRWFGASRNNFMVENPGAIREFVISELFEMQRGKYPGLQFTRENVIVPDLSEVFEAASKIISVPSVNWRETGIFWSAYEIAGGTVTVIPAKAEEIKNQFRCYAETPEERQRLSKVRELCERMNAFIKGESFDPARLNLPDVCHYDHDSGRFEASEMYVKFSLK